MEGERGCSSVVPKFTVQCRENSEEGYAHTHATQEVRGLCHECVCVCYYSHTLPHLSLSLYYIPGTRHGLHNASPPLCAAVEQNKGTLPAETQQPRHMRRGQRVFVYEHVSDRKVENREVCASGLFTYKWRERP